MVLSACCRNARTTSVPEPQLCFPAPDSFSFIVSLCRESCLFFEKSYGVFCDELVQQELDDTTACIPIPDEIREYYRMYRPSPLCRAYRLEEALGTPAKIYYKFEGNNTTGSLGCAISEAVEVAIDEALKCKETGEAKTIVFGLTGTGYFDMVTYEKFHGGKMTDYIPSDADLQKGFDVIPHFPGNE